MATKTTKHQPEDTKPTAKPSPAKEIKSDLTVSERDEVKQAEARTAEAAKKNFR